MKKTTLRITRYCSIGVIGISGAVLFFLSENKVFSILFILLSFSYVFEPNLSYLYKSKIDFSLLVSVVRYIFLGFMLDLGGRDNATSSAFDIINVAVLIMTFLLVVCFSILEFRKRLNIISGTFMLLNIILIYALLYDAIYRINPLAFSGSTNFCLYPFFDFVYYSIVTFTTLGYGDVVPVSIVAKLLSASEAFIFTCMIAFVVMNYGKQLNEKKAKAKTEAMPKNVTKD